MLRSSLIRAVALGVVLALAGCGQTAGRLEEPRSEAPVTGADEGDAPFCDEVGRRLSRADCEDVARLAADAEAGVAAFNAPDPMQRGEERTLELAVSLAPNAHQNEPAQDQGEGLSEPGRTVDALPGTTVEFTPLVGRFMRAELVGAGFEITRLTPASQEVLPDSVTTWSWRVVAREGGQRTLTLTTVVEGCATGGQCYPLRSTSRNYSVRVSVGALGQVQDFFAGVPTWIRLASAIVAALAGLAFAVFSLRNALRGGRER